MSTTFGIKVKPELTGYPEKTWSPEFNYWMEEEDQYEDGIYKIAHRFSGGKKYGAIMYFTCPIAHLLPRDTPVIALDNTAQGIETIGDIIDHIENQKEYPTELLRK
jgi:hypothetical protein